MLHERLVFLHMGCDLVYSAYAAQISGATLIDQMYAGSRLAGTEVEQSAYYHLYRAIVRGEYLVPETFRAPELPGN